MQDSTHHLPDYLYRTSSRHGWLAPVTAASVMLVAVGGLIIFPPELPSAEVVAPKTFVTKKTEEGPVITKEQIVGTWSFYDGISRLSENRLDGTATLNITFDFVTSFIYGSKLKMETEWTLEGDVLTYTVIGGEPEAGLKRLTNDFGSVAVYRILKLTDEEMLLLELNGTEDQYLWKRKS